MTQTKIIIGIGVLIGLLLIKNTKPLFLKVIFIGLAVSYGLGYFAEFPVGTVSFLLFGVLALAFSIWCGINKKWTGLIIGIFTFISFLILIMAYPYSNELKITKVIPIISFLLIFRKLEVYKNEISILTILVSYELSEFLK